MNKYDPKKIESRWPASAKAMAGKQKYNPAKIEKKWQKFWEKERLFEVTENSEKPKYYSLVEFPYPSAEGLHVGHPRPYTAMDVVSRKRRMEGYNVLFPFGFDAFGLPAENFAIKSGKPPAEVTKQNVANFTRQLKSLGYSFDWSRCVDTTDPKYYKWTQWLFLQFFKHGLAYKKTTTINWCPNCKIGLANEEAAGGVCDRCKGPVEKREKEQWMLAITKYADKLLEGLKTVDYIPQAKIQQENWIGRSEGALIKFLISNFQYPIEVFTTRPDTLFGATYLVLSPEHTLINNKQLTINNRNEVEEYIEDAKNKSDLQRTEAKEKTGVELKGIKAINPASGEEIPVWIADYVLAGYGTGAIMAVPAHDARDFEFAKKFKLPVVYVIEPKTEGHKEIWKLTKEDFYIGPGFLKNSGKFDGSSDWEAKNKIVEFLKGKLVTNYKLRDWVFSRQRYWGEPIPLVHCESCENRKYNYILLHGFKGTGESSFRKWLKIELKKRGHKVFSPNLPNTDEPDIEEQVKYVLNNAKINGDTILVGHSLSGAVIFKLLEKIKTKIAKAVLVDCFVRPEFPDKRRPEVEKSCDWKFDFKKIKKQANEFVVLGDANFTTVAKSQLDEMAKIFDAKYILAMPQEGHFKGNEEPEVLKIAIDDGWVALPYSELPLELPKVKKYQPTDNGESPLATMKKWVNTECPRCGGPARRETDTMPNWAGSSWYYHRYCDPHNNKEFASMEKMRCWEPVDWYNGGMEHTVLHLLYSRFWNQFLFDLGLVPTSEPYKKRTSHGMILGSDGEKMSKSRGNVINPDEMVEKFGADAFRTYEMFMGPFDQAVAWDTNGLIGVRRFLDKVWNLQEKIASTKSPNFKFQISNFKSNPKIQNSNLETLLHQTIKKVSEDIEAMRFNTAIAKMMELVNEMSKQETLLPADYAILIKLLSPFAPHLCEELWEKYGDGKPLVFSDWPKYDPALAKDQTITIAVQVNGKVRDELSVDADISEEEIKKLALSSEKTQKWLEGKEPKKVIYVKGRLISIVN